MSSPPAPSPPSLERLLSAAGAAPDGPVARYCRALARMDGAALQACFAAEGATYSSFLVYVHAKPTPPSRGRAAQPIHSDVIPGHDVGAWMSALARDLGSAHVEFESVLLSRDGRAAAVHYTLSGLWSGRLPSMVVGVYDKPLRLRCVDMLRLEANDSADAACIIESRVLLDRLDFLIQIGMASANL